MPRKIKGQNTEDIILNGVGDPTYKKLDKFLDAFGSAGIFEGGTISDSGSGQIDVSAAKGVIRTSDSDVGVLVAFDIDEETNITLTDNSMNYIYINYNSGSPQFAVTTTYEDINLHSEIIIGRVYRMGTALFISNVGQDIQDTILRDLLRIQTVRRLEWASGSILSFVTATRQPTVSVGVFFSNYDKITMADFDASGSDRFTAWYRNGSGGWTYVATQQNVDNANYDNGSGTLQALGVGDYGVHWVYQLTDGSIHIQYGQDTYDNVADARNSTVPTSQPPPVVGLGILIGRLIIAKSATTIYEASSAFSTTFSGTATTNHNDLANIQGGTSGEYYHLTATRHTDLTDGGDTTLHYHAADRNLTNATGTLAIANGGTGLTSPTISDGKVLIGKTDGSFTVANLTQGTGITITNGDGTITIAATGGGGGISEEEVIARAIIFGGI